MDDTDDIVERVVAAVGQMLLPQNLLVRDWLSAEEVGARLGVSTKTLANWRYLGHGPRFQKLSARKVVYPVAEVVAWEETRPVASNTIQAEKLYHALDKPAGGRHGH